jgi:hypothetical protein
VVAAGPGVTKLAGAVPVHTALGRGEIESLAHSVCCVEVQVLVVLYMAGSSTRRRDSLGRAAGRVVTGVEGASLAVLAANAGEDGPLVGAAEKVGETGLLTLCDGDCRLNGPEGLHAGADCRCPCKHQAQAAWGPGMRGPSDLHPQLYSGTAAGGGGRRQ